VVVVEHKMKVVMEISDRITCSPGAGWPRARRPRFRATPVQAVYLGTAPAAGAIG